MYKKQAKNVLVLFLTILFFLLIPLAVLAENLLGNCPALRGDAGAADGPAEGAGPAEEAGPILLVTEGHVVYLEGNQDRVQPDGNLTRAQASKIIYSLLQDPAPAGDTSFADVPAGQWYQEMVDAMASMGLIAGHNGYFRPNDNITRAEFVTILSRIYLPQEGQEDISFTDVDPGHWAYEALCNAVARGWLRGYDGNALRPDGPITRAEAVTVVNRMLGRAADQDAIDARGKILQYVDLPLGHWAYYDIMEASVPHEYAAGEEGAETWTSFTPRTAERAPGYYLENGQLYCVGEDGYYVRNRSVGVLAFDDNGRYTSGNAELDGYLTNIVLAHTDPAASRLANLERLYDYVCGNSRYRGAATIPEGSSGWEAQTALTAFQAGMRGNCYSYAAMFTMLARKLVYQATGISGWATVEGAWHWQYGYYDEHGWTQINEGGTLYFCDPELEGVVSAQYGYNWDLFFKRYGSAATHYRVNGVSLG